MFLRIRNFIRGHFDFSIYWVTIPAIIIAVAAIPMVMYMNPISKIAYENGLLENIQMALLFIGVWLCLKGKTDKKFFNFIFMFLVIIILREVNCGRTLFFPVEGLENVYYRWEDIRYGYLVNPIFGCYIAWTGFYFLKNKLFINLWKYITGTKIPVWNVLLMIAGAILGLYAEHATENFVFEECAELLFYAALIGIIWLYTRNEKFFLTEIISK